ncbi:hypothetical protein AD931_02335 [Gluconobacter oxydans]|uniref:DUF2612 domain-containing protein n=2 Tax=Gluconobacter oxydans TaxID=442 RepID=A0AB34XL23_GLUOY|nr:DUF2612 domain-containing protein [Gluconobacter oxydans]AHK72187.1 putative DUF2612 family protein [Gluconobacter oxydans DSM 3504]KXV09999.1 hypothetical protein AD931_02335 [Gluconobacter oxydans]
MLNVEATIQAQFANSPSLGTIIEGFNQAIDPSALIDDWYENVWNPQTATGWGLDVWGRIVGVSRVLQISTTDYFGFSQGMPGAETFGSGAFYNGGAVTSNYILSDDAFRRLIFAKAAANIWDGTISALNAILMSLFGNEGVLVFEFVPSPVDISIIASGILPRPCGVKMNYIFTPPVIKDTDFGGDLL